MDIPVDMRQAAEAVMPDVQSIGFEPLTGGSSASVALLTLMSEDGHVRRVVFRQHANRALKEQTSQVAVKEFYLTQELQQRGFEVATPLCLHGQETVGGPWLVTELVDGSSEVGDDDVAASVTLMADFLARLHCVDPAGFGSARLTPIEDPSVALATYLPDDEVGHDVRHALALLDRIQQNADVLLHGDFWPGNVIFRNGRLAAVIDWEDAKIGDPLADLACARVEVSCSYGVGAAEQFTQEYLGGMASRGRPTGLDGLPLWDMYVSTTALAYMHLWDLSPADEATRRTVTSQFFKSAAERFLAD